MSDWADEEAAAIMQSCSVSEHYCENCKSGGFDRDVLITALRAAERKGLERAKAICDGWKVDLMNAGDQFDKDGDIYPLAGMAGRLSKDIQSLIDKPETEEKR
jgi:hypothetical protein